MGYSNVAGDLNVLSVTTTQDLVVRGDTTLNGNLIAPTGFHNFGNVSVANLVVTGNFTITATNTQTTNSLTITNAETATALKVTQNEGGGAGHIHNVAEFYDGTLLAMVIDIEGNVGIHTSVSPGYALTVVDGVLIDNLTLTNPLAVSAGGIGVTTTTQNYVFAGPQFGSGAPDFRYLVNSDLPSVISVSNVSGNGSGLSSLIGSNVTGNVAAATVALVVSGAAQPNITSVGLLSNLAVSNSVTTSNAYLTGDLNVQGVSNLWVANIANIYTTNIVGFIGSQWTTGTGNVYYLGNVGIGTDAVSANLTVEGNVYASNSLSTTNAYLTGVLNVQGVSNLWNANVANVYAMRYFGDGGLLSNITSFANLVVSNAVTTTNLVANTLTLANTSSRINVLGSVTASTFYGALAGANTGAFSNIYSANALTTTNLFANTMTLANASASITGNLYVSNALTTTNLYTAGISSNASNTIFNYDTFTISYIYATTLNATTSNVLTQTIQGSSGQPSLQVTGNLYASNAVSTTNAYLTGALNVQGVSNLWNANVANVYALRYFGDGGLLSNITSFIQPVTNLVVSNAVTTTNLVANTLTLANATASITGNLYVSNALSTTNAYLTGALNVQGVSNLWIANVGNVYAMRYFGDGGLLSNVTGLVTGNVLSNLNASNLAFGIVNSALILGNTLSNIQFSNVTGLVTGNVLSNLNASNLAFGTINSALILGNTLSNIQFANVAGLVTGNVLSNINASNLAFGTINSALILGNTLSNLNASNLAFGVVNSALILGNTLSNIQFSNVSGLVTGNVLSNLNASNLAFGIVNSALILGNTLSNISSSNITGNVANATVALVVSQASQPNITSVGILSNLTVSNAVTTTNLVANTMTLSNATARITGNIYVSNSVSTTNIYATQDVTASNSLQTGSLYVSQGGSFYSPTIGSQSASQNFPETAATGSTVTTALGTYTISASSATDPAWQVFDSSTSTYWLSTAVAGSYQSGVPYGYIGGLFSTSTSTTSYGGEWIQLQSPVKMALTSVVVTCGIYQPTYSPGVYVILGNNTGGNTGWTLLATQSGYNTPQTTSITGSANYNYIRIVFTNSQGLNSGSTGYFAITVLALTGTYLVPFSQSIYSQGTVGIGTTNATANLQVIGNVYASNAVTTTNIFANTLSLSNATASITGNLYVSNALSTTNAYLTGALNVQGVSNLWMANVGNVYALRYFGDGGLLVNVSSGGGFTQPLANLVVSNSVTTTNLFTAGITSNYTNTTFNYDTFVVPYIFATTANVSSTSNCASTFAAASINCGTSIGIGTASPVAPLSTYTTRAGFPDTTGSGTSNVVARIQSGSICLDFGSIGGTNPFWLQNHLNTNWATNYQLLLNPNGGNVGIGTASPGSPLTVYGSNTAYVFTIGSYNTTLDFQPGTRFGTLSPGFTTIDPNGSSPQGLGIWDHLAISGTCAIGSAYAQTTPSPANSLIVSGSVGIGTATCANPLHVSGGRTRLVAGSETYSLGVSYSEASGGFYYIGATNSATPDMVFSQVGGSERMRITNAGNVGIGTTNATTRLFVSGGTIQTSFTQGTALPEAGQAYFYNPTNSASQDASCAVRIAGSSARYAYFSYDVSGVAGYSHGILGSSQNLVFRASWDMSAGTIFTMDRTGNFTAAADITAYSDKRIKTDIKLIEDALNKVSKIGGYTFTRTDEVSKGQRQAGVLAQEVLEVLPEVVRINEETGYYTVSYGNITALLIEALKEERQKREALEERLERLEKLLEQK